MTEREVLDSVIEEHQELRARTEQKEEVSQAPEFISAS